MITFIKNTWNNLSMPRKPAIKLEGKTNDWTSVVHIGAGKCGSSSLQAALSNQPTFTSASLNRTFKYYSIQPKATLEPAQIKRMVSPQINGIPSHSFQSVFYTTKNGKNVKNTPRIAEVRRHFKSQVASSITPIFSSEALVYQLEHARFQKLFEELNINALVCLYIRPQVELVNSSWWQWGVWENASFSDWLDHNRKLGSWNQHVKDLRKMSFVRKMHVGVVSNDVVLDFFQNLGVSAPNKNTHPKVNKSLGIDALSFLIRNRQYRPGPHVSKADLLLERFPISVKKQAPWCLSPKQIKSVLDVHKKGNEELLTLLPEPLSDQISNDKKWWSAEAYSNRKVWDWQNLEVNDHTTKLDIEMRDFLEANGMK